MKVLYYDCFAGISGDMNLAALVDIASNEEEIIELFKNILPLEVEIEFKEVMKNGMRAKKINVIQKKEVHRHISDIKDIIISSKLKDSVIDRSLKIFEKIALAESKIHNVPIEKVHFHEIGAVDTIVDILGCAYLLDKLNVSKIFSSPIEIGNGFITFSHGKFKVPAPATAEILKNVPLTQNSQGEATTPTGAAIITTITDEFKFPENLVVEKIGYGGGDRDIEIPNVLRVFYGELKEELKRKETLIEVNIDDMPAEQMEYLMEKLFENGALDVFFTPIIMKKSRPAYMLNVLCKKEKEEEMERIIFLETTTFGLRKINVEKVMLDRKIESINTPYGILRIKKASFNGKEKIKFEYEDIKRIAKEKNIPFNEVLRYIENK